MLANEELTPLPSDSIRTLLALGLAPESQSGLASAVAFFRQEAGGLTDHLLKNAIRDLRHPVLPQIAGPLGFDRLVTLTDAERCWLGNRSFLEALVAPDLPRTCLQALVEYAEMLTASVFPDGTRITGALLHALSLATLKRRFHVRLEPTEADSIAEILRALAATPAIPQGLREQATRMAAATAE